MTKYLKKKQNLVSQYKRGFTLLEVLISTMLFSTIILLVVKGSELLSTSENTIQTKNAITAISGLIEKTLNNYDGDSYQCAFSFYDMDPILKSKPEENFTREIKVIKDRADNIVYKTGNYYGWSDTEGNELKPVALSKITLTNIRKNGNDEKQASAILKLSFNTNWKKFFGNQEFTRELDMDFELDDSFRPTSCVAYGGSIFKEKSTQVTCAKNGIVSFDGQDFICGELENIVGQTKSIMPCSAGEVNGSPYDSTYLYHPWSTRRGAPPHRLSFGDRCATLHTAQNAAKAMNFVHSENALSHNDGLTLHSFRYDGKSDGIGVIDVVIPFRYLRGLPGDKSNNYNYNYTNGLHAFIWVKEFGRPDNTYTYAGGGLLDNPFKKPQSFYSTYGASAHENYYLKPSGRRYVESTYTERMNDIKLNTGVSFGGTSMVHGDFATTTNTRYVVKVQVGMPDNSPGIVASRPPAFFGTLKFSDHYSEGAVIVKEIIKSF